MAEKMAGELNSWDVRSSLEIVVKSGRYNTGDDIVVRGVITNILHRKDGKVRVQIEKNKDLDGLRYGATMVYARSTIVKVYN